MWIQSILNHSWTIGLLAAPFTAKKVEVVPQETKPDHLSKPSAAGLAYLLRHKELWPENFEFNYSSFGYCACGLAYRYWVQNKSDVGDIIHWVDGVLRPTLGVDEDTFFSIFASREAKGKGVGAEDIATDLDKLS
jgi:hypothetical protein